MLFNSSFKKGNRVSISKSEMTFSLWLLAFGSFTPSIGDEDSQSFLSIHQLNIPESIRSSRLTVAGTTDSSRYSLKFTRNSLLTSDKETSTFIILINWFNRVTSLTPPFLWILTVSLYSSIACLKVM
ncbi:hypothetical protein P667_3615 [Acinetobacter baumannii UH5107]|nr:hypothetical protein P667_3615 [Acinetobacter baumannii UH5107]